MRKYRSVISPDVIEGWYKWKGTSRLGWTWKNQQQGPPVATPRGTCHGCSCPVVAAAVLGGRRRAVRQDDRNCGRNRFGVFCRREDADIICNCVPVSSVCHLLARRYSRWPNLEAGGENFGAAGFRYRLADPAADSSSSNRDHDGLAS